MAMSDDERSSLALKVERIETLLVERQAQAASNSIIIRTLALGVTLQLLTTVYLAGVKTQKLDMLAEQVAALSIELHQRPLPHAP